MKTILIDAVYCFVSDKGEIFQDMYKLLELYPNKKIIVTGADDEQFKTFGLDKMPYEVFTLKHNPEKVDPQYFKILLEHYELNADQVVYFEHSDKVVKSAESIGIESYFYDENAKDLEKLKEFLDREIAEIESAAVEEGKDFRF